MSLKAICAVGLMIATTALGSVDAAPITVLAPSSPPSAFHPLTPCRLADTRETGSPVPTGGTLDIDTSGRCDIPDGSLALAIVVTVTGPAGSGFLTVWPTGQDRPEVSNVNYTVGSIRANGAIVQVGAGRSISIYAMTKTDVVVDVTGAFVEATAGVARSGRFVPLTPARLLDTRLQGGRLAPNGTVNVPLPSGVPANAVAIAANITTTESRGAGYFTAYPSGSVTPIASVLNTDGPAQTRAAGVIVAVDAGGFDVRSQRGEHVIVDIVGYFTGPSAPESATGLFVPAGPTRVLDTRHGGKAVFAGGSVILETEPLLGSVSAVVGNWTITDAAAPGFVTLYPAFTSKPWVSLTNAVVRGDTVANFGISPVSDIGLALYTQNGGHLIADITGWFTGSPMPTDQDTAPYRTTASAEGRRVLLVGDSTLAGLRWYTSGQTALRGADYVLDAESCRRLIGLSCVGREGRRPSNAVDAIAQQPGTFESVVVMAGYDDWYTTMSAAFDEVVAAARAKGADEIVWLTYRTGPGIQYATSYAYANQIIRDKLASGSFPDVRIADWSTYTAGATSWFASDGIHLSITGAYGVADYISRDLAAGWGQPCPMPWSPGAEIESPCTSPDLLASVVDVAGVYNAPVSSIYCYQIGADRLVVCSTPG